MSYETRSTSEYLGLTLGLLAAIALLLWGTSCNSIAPVDPHTRAIMQILEDGGFHDYQTTSQPATHAWIWANLPVAARLTVACNAVPASLRVTWKRDTWQTNVCTSAVEANYLNIKPVTRSNRKFVAGDWRPK